MKKITNFFKIQTVLLVMLFTLSSMTASASHTFEAGTLPDVTPPEITCAGPVTINNTPGLCSGTTTLEEPTVTDNCTGGLELVTNGDFFLGQYEWTNCGNNMEIGPETIYGGSDASNWVTEIDHEPVSICQNISGFVIGKTYELSLLASRRIPSPATVGAIITIDGGALSETVLRSNTVFNWTLETFTFVATQTTHQLTMLPSAGWSGTLGLIVDDISIKESSVTVTNDAPEIYPVGETIVTWTATDAYGNEATCEQIVTVVDNEAPEITCADPVTIDNTPGLCSGTTTLTEPVVTDNCPDIRNALNFDGVNDYVGIGNVSSLNFERTDVFSVEAWVKYAGDGIQTIFSKMNNAAPYSGYELWSYNGGVSVYLINTYPANIIAVSTNNYPLSDGQWHHVAMTYSGNSDASGVKIYVDGVLQINPGTINSLSGSIQTTAPAQIGARSPGKWYWHSTLDEVRIWSTERTETEIQTNMYSEIEAQSGLVAAYHFNEGIAGGNNTGITAALDASGNNLNGTLNNFALSGSTSNWVVGNISTAPNVTNDAPEIYPVGETIVTWTATDASGNEATCEQIVTVVDNEAPEITTVDAEMEFVVWPPNHKYTTFAIGDFLVSIEDNCAGEIGLDAVTIVNATSDEVENSEDEGDGNTFDDIVISDDCQSIQLRKERQGGGNGRVYTIYFEVEDENGNIASASAQVEVPHDQNGTAIDDGVALYEEFCGTKSSFIAAVGDIELKNYPNPFKGTTTIQFTVEQSNYTKLVVFNSMGVEVATLFEGVAEADQVYKVEFNASNLAGGVYFYHLQSGETINTMKKMLLIK